LWELNLRRRYLFSIKKKTFNKKNFNKKTVSSIFNAIALFDLKASYRLLLVVPKKKIKIENTHFHSLSLSHTCTYSLSLSHTHSTYTLSHTHTLILSLSDTHIHSRTHTYILPKNAQTHLLHSWINSLNWFIFRLARYTNLDVNTRKRSQLLDKVQ
jgi:hypothetical protein